MLCSWSRERLLTHKQNKKKRYKEQLDKFNHITIKIFCISGWVWGRVSGRACIRPWVESVAPPKK
jgi:hypothetical protein